MTTTLYGLDVRARHRVQAATDHTWHGLLDLTRWWPLLDGGPCWKEGAHLHFQPWVGGRFGTVTGTGFDAGIGGTLWGVVAAMSPGRALVLDGSMGIGGPVAGQWRMDLQPDGGGTVVTITHRVLGPVDEDGRSAFTTRWPTTVAALAGYVEALPSAAGQQAGGHHEPA